MRATVGAVAGFSIDGGTAAYQRAIGGVLLTWYMQAVGIDLSAVITPVTYAGGTILPRLRAVFDPANFVEEGIAPYTQGWKVGLDKITEYFTDTHFSPVKNISKATSGRPMPALNRKPARMGR